jgi:hypothetical protein
MSLTWRRSRITGAGLVAAQYDLTLERQTIMDNILFIPGIANPVSEINQLLFGQGQQGTFIAPSLTPSLISGSTFGTGVETLPDLSPRNNPFSQANSGNRAAWFREPKTGRRNLLDATATLSTQSVTVAAVQKTLSFRGTGTVTLSGASTAGPLVGTGANDIVSLTFTPSAGSLTLTVSGTVNDAQLNTGATRGAYQNVVSAFDITEQGQRDCFGVRFDGTDDFYTRAMDLTATNKVTMFVSMIRRDNSGSRVIVELSDFWNDNNGGFFLGQNQASDNFQFGSRGTTSAASGNLSVGAINNHIILRGEGDISAPISRIARQATVVTNTASQGTSNYGNYTLYLGRRGATTVPNPIPFNGDVYALIVAGGSYPLSTIQRVERILSRITPTVNL